MSAVYLLQPQLQIDVIVTYTGLHFLFALGTPLWQSRKTLHEWKDNSVLAKPLAAYVPVYIQHFPSYSNGKCKNRSFHVPQATFFSRGDASAIITQLCCMHGKKIQCLPNPSQPVGPYLSVFNSFRVIRCLSQYVIPKIAIIITFWFPLGTPLGKLR